MKSRKPGLLSDKNIKHDSEQFDYINELHEYLWCFVRCEFPFAQGNLQKYLDVALENAKHKTKQQPYKT